MIDKKFRVPRLWSNRELKKFGDLFSGSVVNVSGWRDQDKEGKTYKDYFSSCSEYWITNYKTEARGFQGDLKNEIFLDLTSELEKSLYEKFDVVFNHTALEHIFEISTAFANLCRISKDIVIVIVPFLQEEHGGYGDFWRFSPQCVDMLFRKNGLETVYLNYNDASDASIYIFAIGAKNKEKWNNLLIDPNNKISTVWESKEALGSNIIGNSIITRLKGKIMRFLK